MPMAAQMFCRTTVRGTFKNFLKASVTAIVRNTARTEIEQPTNVMISSATSADVGISSGG